MRNVVSMRSSCSLVSAGGEGAVAALMIRRYLQMLHEAPKTDAVERDMANMALDRTAGAL